LGLSCDWVGFEFGDGLGLDLGWVGGWIWAESGLVAGAMRGFLRMLGGCCACAKCVLGVMSQ
jgi:hypothetical protein